MLSKGELHRITFRYTDISQSRRVLAWTAWALNRNGIIRLTGVVSPNLVLALNHKVNDLLKSLKIYRTSGILPNNIANIYLNTQEKLMLAGYKISSTRTKLLSTPAFQDQTAEAEAML